MSQEFFDKLIHIVTRENVLTDEPMKAHTTFRTGGPADYFITPGTPQEIAQTVRLCREYGIPFYIMGNGSNLLVSDKGYRGAVIQIFKKMNRVIVEGEKIDAQAGALLSVVASRAYEASLGGFEFASGIPGTLGGACVMNAGAYGKEMKDVLKSVTVMGQDGNILRLSKEELNMGYRTSVIAEKGYTVLRAELILEKKDQENIRSLLDELKEKRVSRQPLEYASAGSTFKRPEGHFAGKLIQDSGLRGYAVGDAQVSEKHCGFIVNKGNASASEIMELIHYITKTVEHKFGVRLETEVKKIGEF